MAKKFEIRNSTAEFLTFVAEGNELRDGSLTHRLPQTLQSAQLTYCRKSIGGGYMLL